MKKILIIRLSSLGDVLLTTPVISALKKYHPEDKIDFLVNDSFKDAVLYNPNLNAVISYSKNDPYKKYRKLISENNYEKIIDLQNNNRSRKICKGFPGEIKTFRKPTFKKILLVWFKINKLIPIKTIPERYSEAAGIKLNNEKVEIHFRNKIEFNTEKYAVGFCPGSKHFTKTWPREYFEELGNTLSKEGFKIYLFGGKEDREICKYLAEKIENAEDHSNDDNLLELSEKMKRCSVLLCNDSGLMHVACALDVPLIAVFGSTVKEFGFTPYNCRNLILENNSLSCRPCSHIGRESCPKSHFKCMKDITPKIAAEKFKSFYSQL